jgi:hypothetical protein
MALYKRSYCKRVIALGKRGRSRSEIAKALGVAHQALTGWARQYPQFADALEFAQDCALAYWERQGHKAIVNSSKPIPKQDKRYNKRTRRKWRRRWRERFNTALWVKTMEHRFPREYNSARVRHESPHSLKNKLHLLANEHH